MPSGRRDFSAVNMVCIRSRSIVNEYERIRTKADRASGPDRYGVLPPNASDTVSSSASRFFSVFAASTGDDLSNHTSSSMPWNTPPAAFTHVSAAAWSHGESLISKYRSTAPSASMESSTAAVPILLMSLILGYRDSLTSKTLGASSLR